MISGPVPARSVPFRLHLTDIFGRREVPMPLRRVRKRRQQDMPTCAARPVRSPSRDSQGILTIVAAPDIARPPLARLRRFRSSKRADRAIAMTPGHRHDFGQGPRRLRALRLTAALAQDLAQFATCRGARCPRSPALGDNRIRATLLVRQQDPSKATLRVGNVRANRQRRLETARVSR